MEEFNHSSMQVIKFAIDRNFQPAIDSGINSELVKETQTETRYKKTVQVQS